MCVRRSTHTATHSSHRCKLASHEVMSLRNFLLVPSTTRERVRRLSDTFGFQALLGYIKFDMFPSCSELMYPFTGNSGKFTWISVFALGLHVSIVTAKIIKYSYFVRCTGLCVLVSAVVHCPSSIVFNKQRLPTNWLYCTWRLDFSGG